MPDRERAGQRKVVPFSRSRRCDRDPLAHSSPECRDKAGTRARERSRDGRVAARAQRLVAHALDMARKQARAAGVLDMPLAAPRDTLRRRIRALERSLARFMSGR